MKGERRRIWIGLLFVVLLTLLAFVSVGCAADTYTVCPGGGCNYTKIQDAIDAANPLDTIIVRDGTYTENVDVDVDNLTIRSENGSENCIVQALSVSDHVFEVTADYVSIGGFTIQNATGSEKAGIYLTNADHCTISENNASGNAYGIFMYSFSDHNTITNNNASDNNYGIYLFLWNNNNNLTGNTASDNNYGIYLCLSDNNNLTANIASNNNYGIHLSTSINNNLTGNTASDNNYGIYLDSASYNNLTANTASDSKYHGIVLTSSTNNNLTGNTVNSTNYQGIVLISYSDNNHIYNNYFDNTNNAWDDGNNIWNITKTEERNIIGGPNLGGNYWSDYTGNDTNGDGFGDTPYDIPGGANKDSLPLVAIAAPEIFDTGKGEYPSIAGTHNGTIKLNHTITVSKLYTYPCSGTGGHTEYVKIWKGTETLGEESWNGYTGDWHNITFNNSFTLYANETYNYTIRTGSYPQIIHETSWNATGGVITCSEFVDLNGKRHEGWIPTIRLS